MNLKSRILIGLVLAVCVPVLVTSMVVSQRSSDIILNASENSLSAVSKNKAVAVESYFKTIKSQLESFSENKMVVDAAIDFKREFHGFLNQNDIDEAQITEFKSSLSQYYFGDFSEEYSANNFGKSVNTETLINGIDEKAVAFQYHFIANNKNPLGSKHLLDKVDTDKSAYSKIHESVHPIIRSYLEKFGYYDIFIVDSDTGHIIYSVFKELDFATSLKSGPYKDTGIGQAFKRANAFSDGNQVTLTDYASYGPSYEAPASFMASPIQSKGKTIAVAIFQMPIDRLTSIMNHRDGLGETGESYLVGSDFLPRSDSFHDKENRSVNAAYRKPDHGTMKSDSITAGLSGQSGTTVTKNYLETEVISSYIPVNVLNHRWVLIAEVSKSEAFSSVDKMLLWIAVSSLLIVIIAIFIGWIWGSKLGNSIRGNVTTLLKESSILEESVTSMKDETVKLAENVVRSASAVQETASSISEINSTLQTNSGIVDKVVERANDVLGQLKDADSQLHSMNNSFHLIGEGVEKNNEIIQMVEEISDKTKMINEIVFKTQLLAVNASIEAARAGEQGKGFAVVADEVTKLASLSGAAAEQIDKLIGNSRKIIANIVQSNKEIVDQSQDSVKDFRTLFEHMTKDIRTVLESTSDIAKAIHEQKLGVSQVSTAMDEIDSSVQNNQRQTQNSRELADSIQKITRSLQLVSNELEYISEGHKTARRSSLPLANETNEENAHIPEVNHNVDDTNADDDSFKPAA